MDEVQIGVLATGIDHGNNYSLRNVIVLATRIDHGNNYAQRNVFYLQLELTKKITTRRGTCSTC
jgi:hypothetical protein